MLRTVLMAAGSSCSNYKYNVALQVLEGFVGCLDRGLVGAALGVSAG